ncbi:MAG: universal stress protein [Candidatus Bathyarchaeia archaeon]|nr:universal stress protein [Candidatus Bathyarchaeota archaeon]
MSEESGKGERLNKILIPIADFYDEEKITHGLQVLSVFKNPLIVLLHIIEVPSRTQPLNTHPYEKQISEHRKRVEAIAEWLRKQDYEVKVKIALARSVVEGIVTEANTGKYDAVLMLKRRVKKGYLRIFQKSISEAVIRSVEPVVLISLVDLT